VGILNLLGTYSGYIPARIVPHCPLCPQVDEDAAMGDRCFTSVSDLSSIVSRFSGKTLEITDTVTIDGVLNDDGLTVILCSPNSGHTLRKQLCVRFDAQELPDICDIPSHAGRFCDVSAGETSEGRTVWIESHRCYTADSQGNASTIKV
jgi:hypothetical protein